MKRTWKVRLATALAAVMVVFGIGFNPLTANADTVDSVTAETSAEIGAKTDETETVDKSIDTTEETATKQDKKEEITLDDILEFTGGLADEAGLSDEWAEAVENLKTAASEKKVDIMTGVSLAQAAMFAAYVLGKIVYARWKKHKDTSAEDVKKTKKAVGEQTKAVNELIGHAETVANNVAEASEREKQLAIAGQEQNAALRCLFNGVQLKQSIKDEAMRHLNKSDACYDDAKK